MFEDKYKLSLEQNIFVCKKLFSSIVYCGLKMENRNITFPQTQVILEGLNVSGVALDDICAILGLKHAFKVFFDKIGKEEISLELIKEFNLYIAKDEAIESGVIRSGKVSIAGTDYIPPVLSEQVINNSLNEILFSKKSNTLKALEIFSYIIYSQIFWDGNKRTALLASNYFLVSNGGGVINISDSNILEFAELLNDYFNSGKKEKLLKFLFEKCICGID